jgi:hypothetical protein
MKANDLKGVVVSIDDGHGNFEPISEAVLVAAAQALATRGRECPRCRAPNADRGCRRCGWDGL